MVAADVSTLYLYIDVPTAWSHPGPVRRGGSGRGRIPSARNPRLSAGALRMRMSKGRVFNQISGNSKQIILKTIKMEPKGCPNELKLILRAFEMVVFVTLSCFRQNGKNVHGTLVGLTM